MADAEVTYETKSVRAVRGMESRTVAKWEADGWELVSQSPGRLQTELTFRRPKPKSRTLLWAIVGGGVAIVLAIIIIIGVVGERNAPDNESPNAAITEAPSAAATESLPTPTESSSAEETAPPSAEPAAITLTSENNAELAALLTLTDYCDPSIAAFAAMYRGQTIEFPGYIGALGPHDGATTRYDILLSAGDFSETSAPGPAFQYRDVNTTSDLSFTGTTPDTIGVGTNLVVTAEVDEYEQNSCLFLLDPVATAVR
jgi:hypothetical protein